MKHYIESASKFAKDCGLDSLKEVADLCKVKYTTLYRWFRLKPDLFMAVVWGAMIHKEVKEQSQRIKEGAEYIGMSDKDAQKLYNMQMSSLIDNLK